jgi:hypothetical protein
MESQRYDYSKLRGRITEKCGKQKVFAELLGVSEGTLTSKLQGYTYFTQNEIMKSIDILGIDPSKLNLYFFTEAVQKIEQED